MAGLLTLTVLSGCVTARTLSTTHYETHNKQYDRLSQHLGESGECATASTFTTYLGKPDETFTLSGSEVIAHSECGVHGGSGDMPRPSFAMA